VPLNQIPPGTLIREALAVMQSAGFDCKFKGDELGRNERYLDCWLSTEQEWCKSRQIQVKIFYQDGKITEVRTIQYIDSPKRQFGFAYE